MNLARQTRLCSLVLALAPLELGPAPDGHPGFGRGVELADVRHVFLSPDAGQRELLARLQELEATIRIGIAAEEVRAAERGDFELLPSRAPRTLASLHAAWFAAAGDLLVPLSAGGARARALARMASNVRFRLRADVLVDVEREFADLTGALGVMQASFDGYADLSEDDVRTIARRADLAAARLRAVSLDLEALREDEPLLVDPALEALAEGKRGALADARAALATLERRCERVSGSLFTTRLRQQPTLRVELEWRDGVRAATDAALANVRTLMPDTAEGRAAPREVARLSDSERRRYASFAAQEALRGDPLDEDLNWYAAEALDFLWGPLESRRYYDRYLALRGIRAHDSRSYRYADLDQRGRRAVERVQAPIEPPLPPR